MTIDDPRDEHRGPVTNPAIDERRTSPDDRSTGDRGVADLGARGGRELPSPGPGREPAMSGPSGRATTTESVGDPDRDSTTSGAQSGAGAGAILGTGIAGPIGGAVGAVIGAAAGTGAGTADRDAEANESGPLRDAGSEGTMPADPAMPLPEDDASRDRRDP